MLPLPQKKPSRRQANMMRSCLASCHGDEAVPPTSPSGVNVFTFDTDDDDVRLPFKRGSTSVKNRPSVVNPVSFDSDDYEAPTPFKRATTFVKNRTWGVNAFAFDTDDDDVPLSFKRTSVSLKSRPTDLKQKSLEGVDCRLLQDHNDEQYSIKDSEGDGKRDENTQKNEDGEGDDKTQKIEDHAKAGRGTGGKPKKKHKGTTSVPNIEDIMSPKIKQANMEHKASQQGQQYSISRCLEVLHVMDDVSDEIKVLASDVLKDAASREFFLCYESRLRGLWLKKEVAKLVTQLPPC